MTTPVRVAGAVLRQNGRLLLCFRSGTRAHYPSVWDLPGGHIDDGESPLAAIRRELVEELDIVVESDAAHLLETLRRPTVELSVFVIDRWTGIVRNAAPDEHEDLRWVDLGELDALQLADESYPALLRRALEWRREFT